MNVHYRYQCHLSLRHSMIHFKYCMNSNTRGKVNSSQTILQHKITTLCMESAALQLPEAAAERRSSPSRYCGSGHTCRYKQDATVCQLLIPLTYRTHTTTTLPLPAPPQSLRRAAVLEDPTARHLVVEQGADVSCAYISEAPQQVDAVCLSDWSTDSSRFFYHV